MGSKKKTMLFKAVVLTGKHAEMLFVYGRSLLSVLYALISFVPCGRRILRGRVRRFVVEFYMLLGNPLQH